MVPAYNRYAFFVSGALKNDGIRDWLMQCAVNIDQGRFVCEYVGELVSSRTADIRQQQIYQRQQQQLQRAKQQSYSAVPARLPKNYLYTVREWVYVSITNTNNCGE
jgi:hypothetical protein